MTLEHFIAMLTCGSMASSLLCQALKKTVKNIPSNLVALFSAFVVGTGGSLIYYSLSDIPFTAKNVECAILLGIAMWVGSMCGYDKVRELLKQWSK